MPFIMGNLFSRKVAISPTGIATREREKVIKGH